MRKEGRAIAVLVLLVFFILAVAACGYFMIKLDKKEKEMQAVQEDLNQIKEELGNKNKEINEEKQDKETKKDEASIDVDALNKEHCERILKIMGAGSFDSIYLAIMEKENNENELNNLTKNSTTIYKNNYSYNLIDESYSNYEKEWSSFLSKSLYEKLASYRSINSFDAFISVDGKVAINQGGWSGRNYKFYSQNLISKNDNIYIYEVTYQRAVGSMDSQEYETLNATVTGRVEGSNYIIEKFENK